MSDQHQRHSSGVPWADHTEPSSSGESNPADRSARIDPEELDDTEVSPGGLATSSSASPRGDDSDDPDAQRESRPVRDVGAGSQKVEHKPD